MNPARREDGLPVLERLRREVAGRPGWLVAEIAGGREVVGTFSPFGPPAEIIEAAGALPFRLLATGGGDAELNGISLLGRDSCSFCRAVVGQAMAGRPPVSVLASGTVCDRLRRAAERLSAAAGLPFLPVALPRTREDPEQEEFVAGELRLFARELGARTGIEVTGEGLMEAIHRGNRVREVLSRADLRRREDPPRLTGLEFFDLVRAAHALDSGTFLALSEGLDEEIGIRPPFPLSVLRIFLAGPTLPDDRREVPGILEENGQAIVVGDATDSGSLGIGPLVFGEGDPFLALARAVLSLPLLAAPPRPSTPWRDAFDEGLARARADGVVFRVVPFCRPFLAEAPVIRERTPVPFLLVTEEGGGAKGQLRTRLQAFLEGLTARRKAGR